MGRCSRERVSDLAARPIVYRSHQLAASTDGADSERITLQVENGGRLETWQAYGSGPIDAMVKAIALPFDVLSYEEHSRGQGSAAKAVSYIEITTRSRRTLFGAGMHPNIITASLAGDLLGGEPGGCAGGVAGAGRQGPHRYLRRITAASGPLPGSRGEQADFAHAS